MQDVASGMWKPPRAATCCPSQDVAGVLHKLENLTGVGFCHLCYNLGGSCRCSRAPPQAPPSYRDQALWVPPSSSCLAQIPGGRGGQVPADWCWFFSFCRHPSWPPRKVPAQTRMSHLQLCPPSKMAHPSSLRSFDLPTHHTQRHLGLQPWVYWASVAVGAH